MKILFQSKNFRYDGDSLIDFAFLGVTILVVIYCCIKVSQNNLTVEDFSVLLFSAYFFYKKDDIIVDGEIETKKGKLK